MIDEAMRLAMQSGFNAVLVLLLLLAGRSELRSLVTKIEKKFDEIAKSDRAVAAAMERATQGSMANLIGLKTLDAKGGFVVELAKKIQTESHDAEQRLHRENENSPS